MDKRDKKIQTNTDEQKKTDLVNLFSVQLADAAYLVTDPQKRGLVDLTKRTARHQRIIVGKFGTLQKTMEVLLPGIKSVMFDLEATRRELKNKQDELVEVENDLKFSRNECKGLRSDRNSLIERLRNIQRED